MSSFVCVWGGGVSSMCVNVGVCGGGVWGGCGCVCRYGVCVGCVCMDCVRFCVFNLLKGMLYFSLIAILSQRQKLLHTVET